MKIFYDARTIRPGMTGVGRCAFELLKALGELSDPPKIRALALRSSKIELHRVLRDAPIEWIETDSDYESHPSGDWYLRFGIPHLVEHDEIYHGPAFSIPGGSQTFPRVVTIHDLGVFNRPEDYSWKFGAYMRWRIRGAARHADRIIVPSRAAGSDFSRCFPRAANKVRIVPEAGRTPLELFGGGKCGRNRTDGSNRSNAAQEITGEDYVLSVGAMESRKDPWTALGALG